MFRFLFCCWLACADANRIKSHDLAKANTTWGATCESLQSTFHSRMDELQALLDAQEDDANVGMTTRTRLSMKTLAIARVMRRARECGWMLNTDSDDVQRMQGLVARMLEGNPCIEAARAELDAASEDEAEALRRALSVLASENCEVTIPSDEDAFVVNIDDSAEVSAQLDQADQEAQDAVDQLTEAAMDEGSSFVETSGVYGSFMRTLGVVLLFLLLLLACATTAAFIAGFLFSALASIGMIALSSDGFGRVAQVMGWFMAGGLVGLVGCGYQLANTLLPALEQ